jgi:hypothetical protein
MTTAAFAVFLYLSIDERFSNGRSEPAWRVCCSVVLAPQMSWRTIKPSRRRIPALP